MIKTDLNLTQALEVVRSIPIAQWQHMETGSSSDGTSNHEVFAPVAISTNSLSDGSKPRLSFEINNWSG